MTEFKLYDTKNLKPENWLGHNFELMYYKYTFFLLVLSPMMFTVLLRRAWIANP